MGWVVFFGLVLLAVPVAIVYLLVKTARLQRSIDFLEQRIDERARQHYQSAPDKQSHRDELARAREMEPGRPAPVDTPALETKPEPVPMRSNAGNVSSTSTEDQRPPVSEPSLKPSDQPAEQAAGQSEKPRYEPAGPDIGDRIGQFIKDYFTEGNPIVRVGVIVLFFGVAFLLKYAAEHDLLPPELRLAAVALGGLVLLIIGWRLRARRRNYALVMQGGGIGVLYLTMYAALRLYELLPAPAVIIVMLLMVALAAALAVLQNASSLAVVAAVGGFLAPVLTSTGQGSHIVLFSYYLLLNLGILLIAWFKAWRLLNLLGFAFTFVIGTAWGVLRYVPEQYASAQLFLIAFFLFYVAISVLYARRQSPALRGLVDGTLVFGTPLIAFSLQAGLVHGFEYGLAWSALAAGGFYLALATACWRFGGQNYRLLSEAFLALGVVFASLTIPFALDGNGIAAAWALEGAGILWISLRQNHRLGSSFGIALQIAGGLALIAEHTLKGSAQPVFNDVFIGALLVAVAGLFSGWYLWRQRGDSHSWERQASVPMLLWGLCWWFGNGITEIFEYADRLVWLNRWSASLAFIAGSALVGGVLLHRLRWPVLRYVSGMLCFAMAAWFLAALPDQAHPLAHGGYAVWALAFAVLYGLLRQADRLKPQYGGMPELIYWHLIAGLLLTTIVTVELVWLTDNHWHLAAAWQAGALALPALLIVALSLALRGWPVTEHQNAYQYGLCGVLLIGLIAWSILVNITSTAAAAPLPYLPLLNPIDIVQVLAFLVMLAWWRRSRMRLDCWARAYYLTLAALTFVWLNAVLLRTLHHWFGVPYSVEGIIDSELAQACLSIFWTLLGLSVMVLASRRRWRGVWVAAAVLLGAVVIKLFSIDLADSNTLESIFSFIVVGVLLLVIGYYSPIPPGKESVPSDGKPEQAKSG